MSQHHWQIAQGDALTRYRVSALKAERFAEFYTGEGAPLAADESFCRQLFRQLLAPRAIDPTQAPPCQESVVADPHGVIAFTDFYPLAFHLQRWLTIDLYAPESGDFAFRLETCGGVRIWREDALLACFTPLTRNRMQHTVLALPLRAGKNSLLIHLEDLAERDTQLAWRWVYLGTPPLVAALPGGDAPLAASPRRAAVCRNDSADQLLTLIQRREYGPQADALLYSALRHVSAREAYSVFSLPPLLQLWHFHREEYFPEGLIRRIKSTLLGYRYGPDERGCDVMLFTGKCVALAFCAAQYLAGQFFPEACFIASGRRGREQQTVARARLRQWFTDAEAQAFSPRERRRDGYRGLSLFAQLAEDADIRERAGRLAEGVNV